MKTLQATVTVLANEAEAKQYLLNVGVRGPSLHPRVSTPDSRDRWNGWNHAKTIGIDAEGYFVEIESWHFASGGRVDFSGEWNGRGSRLGSIAFDGFNWPIQVFPAIAIIMHPEYTPTQEET